MNNYIENAAFFLDPVMQKLYELCERISKFPNVRTSVGVLMYKIVAGRREYLVVHDKEKNLFGNPAGHCEAYDKDLIYSLSREILEETTIQPDDYVVNEIKHVYLSLRDGGFAHLGVVFSAHYLCDEVFFSPPNDEDVDYAQFLPELEILSTTSEGTKNRGLEIFCAALYSFSTSQEMILEINTMAKECGLDLGDRSF
ncbi:hypothetical protein KA001_02830 [Patescibacteria group bacterium]|nr:hypothetical protein [Patescibacteria group bacterium]